MTASAVRAQPAPLVDVASTASSPDDVTRFCELIAPQAARHGHRLRPVAAGIWEIALGIRADQCCDVMGVTLSITRRARKTWGIMVGLVAICWPRPGTTVVWSSHHDRTSSETLTKIAGIVVKTAIRPKMRAQRPVVFTDDNRGVHFANGSRILFGARSSQASAAGSPRSTSVYDRCQNLKESALTDMLAAMNVSTSAWRSSRAPTRRRRRGSCRRGVQTRRRSRPSTHPGQQGKAQTVQIVYVEFSADRDAARHRRRGFWDHLATATLVRLPGW